MWNRVDVKYTLYINYDNVLDFSAAWNSNVSKTKQYLSFNCDTNSYLLSVSYLVYTEYKYIPTNLAL
jgi:hypothetical protein